MTIGVSLRGLACGIGNGRLDVSAEAGLSPNLFGRTNVVLVVSIWSSRMRKIILVGLLIVLAGIYFQRATVIAVVMERGMDSRMDSNILDSLEDGLHVALCGAGGPMPAPNASGPCVAVVAGDQLFIVDAGTDGVRNLGRMGYQVGDITAVISPT